MQASDALGVVRIAVLALPAARGARLRRKEGGHWRSQEDQVITVAMVPVDPVDERSLSAGL